MNKYTGISCPVCGKLFADGDDVVVCPECGAPHHRDCYHELGSCAFLKRHAPDFAWQGPAPREPAPQHGEPAAVPLPGQAGIAPPDYRRNFGDGQTGAPPQGSENGQNSLPPQGGGPGYGNGQNGAPPQGGGYGGRDDMAPLFQMSQSMPQQYHLRPEEMLDGVSVKDYAQFIGPNAFYYLLRFKAFATAGQSISPNLSAMVFGFFYYFNRKMYKHGAAMLALFLLGIVPLFVISFLMFPVIAPQIPDFLAGAAVQINPGPYLAPLMLCQLMLMVYFVACIASGLFANQLYYRHARREVLQLCKHFAGRPDHELSQALAIRGRTNRVLVIALLSTFIVSYYLFQILITAKYGSFYM